MKKEKEYFLYLLLLLKLSKKDALTLGTHNWLCVLLAYFEQKKIDAGIILVVQKRLIFQIKTTYWVFMYLLRMLILFFPLILFQDIQVMVTQKGSQFILDGGFDVIFSVLELFHKDLPHEFIVSAFER
jgi:hypothetical protein